MGDRQVRVLPGVSPPTVGRSTEASGRRYASETKRASVSHKKGSPKRFYDLPIARVRRVATP